MTEVSFQTAGYAVLTEDDPNQKTTSTCKIYAPAVAYGTKTFSPSQIEMSDYANEVSSKIRTIQRNWTHFLGFTRTCYHHDI